MIKEKKRKKKKNLYACINVKIKKGRHFLHQAPRNFALLNQV